MASEITGIPSTPASILISKVAAQNPSEPRGVQRVDPPSGDRVSLTDAAMRLSRTGDSSNSQPTFDSKRVDDIRSQLANGTHRVNAAQVANKMLQFESTLGGSSSTP